MTSRQWIKIRSVALPSEHGGWAFLLEPILLGLLLAPSQTGGFLAAAACGAFLAHQPLKITLKDWRKGRHTQRTHYAEAFAGGYLMIAAVAFTLLVRSADINDLLPLLVALPLIAIQIGFDVRNKSRALLPELSGSLALSSLAPALVLLGGWGWPYAAGIWALIALRNVTSILYVRERLRLEHGEPIDILPVWIAHIAALAVVVVLVTREWVPWVVVNGMVLLAVRALWGLSNFSRRVRAPIIGMSEIGFGLLYIALIIVGFQ